MRLYAGASCAGAPVATGSAAELAAPGLRVDVAEGATATFTATATDAVGNVSACSTAISYTRTKPVPPPATCVVPKLAGKTLKQARKALAKANCKLGKVTKPKQPKGKKGKKGKKKQPVLVVKSVTPRAGAKPASGKVDVKLGPKPKPKPKKKR